MDTSPAAAGARDAARRGSATHLRHLRRIGTKLTRGGTDGNEQITTITGILLLVLLAAVGATIVWIGQLLWLHLFLGPADRGQLVLIHKVSFIVWLAFTALHVLGHLSQIPAALRAVRRPTPELPGLQAGAAGRWISIAGALVGGLVLAVVLIPDFSIWTAHTVLLHHHH
ncbi:MAG: hypothetical protein M3065_01920 [Actinomycetota bacterium]|nr:hypothetical protein [Actinomycetota bacterium]